MIGYLDCSTGVSGDKFLGALLDIGDASGVFTVAGLQAIIAPLAPEARVHAERVTSSGIAATSVRIEVAEQPTHRHWPDIEALLREAQLPEPVRDTAVRVFEELALAEAAAHGTTVERVHFHEVGALDSIADIVGVCSGVHALGIDSVFASTISLGWGTVTTAHGVLPVPAPATATLLLGIPTEPGPAQAELTTPTGAALVRVLASGFGPMPAMTPAASGYGAGTYDIGTPNVCRLILGEPGADSTQRVVLLETNIDHLPAEQIAFAAEELLGAGALDVWQTPIVMKKGRAAVMLSVLATAGDSAAFAERIIELTGSLGVRHEVLARTIADRKSCLIDTPWGPAHVKVGAGRVRAEHDDVVRIAREHRLPYRAVARSIAEHAKAAQL